MNPICCHGILSSTDVQLVLTISYKLVEVLQATSWVGSCQLGAWNIAPNYWYVHKLMMGENWELVWWYYGTVAHLGWTNTQEKSSHDFSGWSWVMGLTIPIVRILSDGKIWVLWFIMPPKQHPSLESTRHTFWNHHSSSFQKPQNKLKGLETLCEGVLKLVATIQTGNC